MERAGNIRRKKAQMNSAKKGKPAKSKTQRSRLKDLRPAKDAKGGAQKKEGAELIAGGLVS